MSGSPFRIFNPLGYFFYIPNFCLDRPFGFSTQRAFFSFRQSISWLHRSLPNVVTLHHPCWPELGLLRRKPFWKHIGVHNLEPIFHGCVLVGFSWARGRLLRVLEDESFCQMLFWVVSDISDHEIRQSRDFNQWGWIHRNNYGSTQPHLTWFPSRFTLMGSLLQ